MKELRYESKATVTKRRQGAFQTEATEAKGRSQRDPWEWQVTSVLGDHEPKNLLRILGPGAKQAYSNTVDGHQQDTNTILRCLLFLHCKQSSRHHLPPWGQRGRRKVKSPLHLSWVTFSDTPGTLPGFSISSDIKTHPHLWCASEGLWWSWRICISNRLPVVTELLVGGVQKAAG